MTAWERHYRDVFNALRVFRLRRGHGPDPKRPPLETMVIPWICARCETWFPRNRHESLCPECRTRAKVRDAERSRAFQLKYPQGKGL